MTDRQTERNSQLIRKSASIIPRSMWPGLVTLGILIALIAGGTGMRTVASVGELVLVLGGLLGLAAARLVYELVSADR